MDVRLWRRISLWLWFACLLMAVYSAPVNEDGSSPAAVDGSDNGFDSAIEAVARAKRDTRKKSSKSSRSLVRYRYPIQFKRSGGIQHDDEDDYDGNSAEDEDPAAGLLGSTDALDRLDHDNAVDLDELAKEIALDILMEEADKSRPEHRSSSPLIKKKKAAPTAHRPSRYLSLDDKRRKRMNSLVNQLLDEESAAGPLDNEDDEEEQQQQPAEEEGEEEEERTAVDEEGEERDEEDERLEAMARTLANQGLERSEIENLLSQLERLQSSEETNGEKKKKRSSEWRKLPRASLRWRFLHSHGYDDNEPSFGRHQSADEDEPPYHSSSNPVFDQRQGDKSIPFENRFFGRGFHRVGPTIQEEQGGRGIPPSVLAAKRVQHPLKTKNAVSIINKRSIVPEEEEEAASQKEQVAPSSVPIRSQRKRRSPSEGESKLNETSPPPLALPLAESKQETEKNNNKSGETAAVRNKDAHSGVIRKKSIDWDDYFGYDKRSAGGDDEAMRDYLESEYYKTMAGSLAYRKRDEQHAGHGMKKRNNATTANWEKKKRRVASLQDAEEALDAAFRAVEEQGGGDIERVREQLVAELVDNLDEDELEEMTDRLAEELARAIRQEEEEQEEAEEDERNFKKRYAKKKRVSHKKKKSTDERRKRFAVKRSGRHRPAAESDGDDCVIAEQVVSTCNMVSHLYGGYRPVLSDACFRHQACFICSDNEAACDVEFQQRVLALCGPDLLCQSQSRHLLSALGQLDQMELDYLAPMGGPPRVEALCRRDSCLAEFWKRR